MKDKELRKLLADHKVIREYNKSDVLTSTFYPRLLEERVDNLECELKAIKQYLNIAIAEVYNETHDYDMLEAISLTKRGEVNED